MRDKDLHDERNAMLITRFNELLEQEHRYQLRDGRVYTYRLSTRHALQIVSMEYFLKPARVEQIIREEG